MEKNSTGVPLENQYSICEGRGTGRTTAALISGLGLALSKRGETVLVVDHYQTTPFGLTNLKKRLESIIERLGLEDVKVEVVVPYLRIKSTFMMKEK